MHRGSHDTHRWPRRLAPAVLASLVLHALVLVTPLRPLPMPKVNVEINHAVELGLEEPTPGSNAPPPAPSAPSIEEPPPPRPRPRAHRAPRPAPPLPELPAPPDTQLRAPDLVARLTPPSMLMVPDRDADLADAVDESALAAADDAGVADAADESALAVADDAGDDAGASAGIPGIAAAAGSLAAAIPAGSVVTLLLRTDRIRENPNAPRVRSLLRGIRDWQQVLDGTEVDPVDDFNTVLLASADPFGAPGHPPDVLVMVRTRAPRGFFRASVEQMAGARAASRSPLDDPPDGGDAGATLRAHFDQPDAGALARASRAVWRRQGGAEVATIDRYMGPHSVILLGDDLAVIAPPERVPALLAVLAARTGGPAAQDRGRAARLVALLQASGLRNLIRLPGGAGAMPTRVDLALYETRVEGAPDGGAELAASLQFDDAAQAARVAPLVGALIDDTLESVEQFSNTLQGRLASGAGAVHFDRLRGALRALRVTPEGSALRVEATLSRDEVAELLNVQRLVQLFQ